MSNLADIVGPNEEAQKKIDYIIDKRAKEIAMREISRRTKAGHRKERLKSLGNAIVPAVAMEIMKGML